MDSQRPPAVSVSMSLLFALRVSTKTTACMLALTGTTLASCIFYAVGTYLSNRNVVIWVEVAFAVVFGSDWILSLIAAPVS